MISCVAIDPGPTQSALVTWTGVRVGTKLLAPNEEILKELQRGSSPAIAEHWPLAIEMIHSQGMPVGVETFMTCVWIGRFMQVYDPSMVTLITRSDVKLQICGSSRAKDGNVRQALIDRFGGNSVAIGKKHLQGPLYGITSHLWSALAVAIAYKEMKEQ